MTGRGYFDPYGVPLKAPCPACPGRVPMKHQATGLVCPRCRSELLDRHDASVLLAKFALPPLPETHPARQKPRVCGLCAGPMASHRLQSGHTIEICGTCSGIFLECGEARLIHQALAALQAQAPARPSSAIQSLPGAAAAHAPVRETPSGARSREERAAQPSALSGVLGIGRLLFRLSPIVLLVGAGWHFRDTGLRALAAFRSGPSTYSTLADMSSARTALAAEIAGDRWPSDLSAFLRESLQGPTAHLDRWGTPYELRGSRREPVLASCGPDKACGGEDDLLVPLFRKQAPDGPDPGIDARIQN